MESNEPAAQDHLARLDRARQVASTRMRSQTWFHPLFALLTGGFVVSWSLVPTGSRPGVAATFAIAVALVTVVYDRRLGIRASAWRHPGVLAWSALAGVLLIAAIVAGAVVVTLGVSTAVEVSIVVAMGLAVGASMWVLSRQVEIAGAATLDASR